ncbi:MAG: penicillin-binding transpeptidase domain-containing protein [Clostridium sp.]
MKNKKNLILLIASVLIITVTGVLIYFVTRKPNTEKALKEYFELVNNGDYEGMYNKLSNASKKKITKDDFIARNKNIYIGIEAENIEVTETNSTKNLNISTANYSTTMVTQAGEISFDNTMEFVNEDDELKINWSSNCIFPDLNDNYKVKVNTFKSKRGDILDRNDKVLATDGNACNVGIVPGKLGDNKDENLQKISSLLKVSIDDINKKLNASYVKPDMFIPIKVLSGSDPNVPELLKVSGVMINDKPSRVYPLGEQAAHLTGYIQPINSEELKEKEKNGYNQNSLIGKTGLEKMYEDKLRGIDGSEIVIVDEKGNTKTSLAKKELKNGENMKLTIDVDSQTLLYSQIKDEAGTSVAMNPKTGEVLALVSTPSYDPNEFVLGLSDERWTALNNDPKLPLTNRFQSTLTPGSVFKPICGAVALESKTLDPKEDKMIRSLDWQKDKSWGNYTITRAHGYGGPSNFDNAMINSDNIYFAMAALGVGIDNFSAGLNKLGFGEKIPFEYGLYNSQYAKDGKIKSEVQLADTGYGQGEALVNPVHLASIYTMFVNNGSMINPYLLYKDDKTPTIWKKDVISKESADIVLNSLKKVVTSGTGSGANIPGLNLAGKTGTAEIKKSKDDKDGTELGWFIGMTTGSTNSDLLVVTMVEDVKGRGGSGYVVPLVRKAFEELK